MIVTLPWPDKRLSPNARIHWGAKASVKAKARKDAAYLAYAAMGEGVRSVRLRFLGDAPIPVTITFYPPDARHRDDDNMVGAFKSLRDGIADALGVNDRRFRPHYIFADPCKPGRIEVALGAGGGDNFFTQQVTPGLKENGPDTCANTASGPEHQTQGAR